MSKLRIINQPLAISDGTLNELGYELEDYWDHKAENMAMRNWRRRQKLTKVES